VVLVLEEFGSLQLENRHFFAIRFYLLGCKILIKLFHITASENHSRYENNKQKGLNLFSYTLILYPFRFS